jgi:hypothetical protein
MKTGRFYYSYSVLRYWIKQSKNENREVWWSYSVLRYWVKQSKNENREVGAATVF